MAIGSNFSSIYKGVLENAGLGEVSYFLKEAKKNVQYAAFSLEHTDFTSARKRIPESAVLLDDLKRKISELQHCLEGIEQDTIQEVMDREFAEEE